MRRIVTKFVLLTVLLTGNAAFAQIRLPVTDNDLRINLQKIVNDFPHELSALKGDTLSDNPQTIEFSSLLEFEGAEGSIITQYKSLRSLHSWQAVILTSEDFDEAATKYKWLYNQLRMMTINLDGGYSYSLDGKYAPATESMRFSSSIFKLTPNASGMPKLKIEASLHFEFPEWKVSLLVYEKEREDNERGEIHDN